jgi:hypothetical protein
VGGNQRQVRVGNGQAVLQEQSAGLTLPLPGSIDPFTEQAVTDWADAPNVRRRSRANATNTPLQRGKEM